MCAFVCLCVCDVEEQQKGGEDKGRRLKCSKRIKVQDDGRLMSLHQLSAKEPHSHTHVCVSVVEAEPKSSPLGSGEGGEGGKDSEGRGEKVKYESLRRSDAKSSSCWKKPKGVTAVSCP